MNIGALIQAVNQPQLKKNIPDLRSGDTVRVSYRIREGGKDRVQVFEGLAIAKRGGSIQESVTVRKIASGVGVERTFPLHSPWVLKIERLKSGKTRRAKLYFVRRLIGSPRRFRLKDKGLEAVSWSEEQDSDSPTDSPAADQPSGESDSPSNEDDKAEKTAGQPSGESGSRSPKAEGSGDSGPESAHQTR